MLNSLSRAVQFGKSIDKGMEGGCTAFPFMYTFVNTFQDTWDQVKNPLSLQNNHIDLGPVIPAAVGANPGHIQIPVQLDADHMFKLLYIKYSAYYERAAGIFGWQLGEGGLYAGAPALTSITVETIVSSGSLVFTFAGLALTSYSIGSRVKIAETAAPANYMTGTITAYNSGTGVATVSIDGSAGAGIGIAAWTITMYSPAFIHSPPGPNPTPAIAWNAYDTQQDGVMNDSIARWVKVNVSVSHNGRYIYGNDNTWVQTNSNLPILPEMIEAVQGANSGFNGCRTPLLLPSNGMLFFDVYNFFPYDVVLAATIYGMKVKL